GRRLLGGRHTVAAALVFLVLVARLGGGLRLGGGDGPRLVHHLERGRRRGRLDDGVARRALDALAGVLVGHPQGLPAGAVQRDRHGTPPVCGARTASPPRGCCR